MNIVHLDSFEQVAELGADWNDLLRGSRDDQIFLTLEWLATWWKYYGDHRELILLAAKEDSKVLAVAPFMASTYNIFGIKLRKIEFVATPTSDYHSLILTDKASMCVRMFLDYISQYSKKWDCVELDDIPENSETANLLRTMKEKPLRLNERVANICPFVRLPNTFEEYFQLLSANTRRNLKRWDKKLKRDHRVEFEVYNQVGSVKQAMNTFFELHQKRCQMKGYAGLFADKTFRDFHLEVAENFARKGWLFLCFLIVDDKPAAAQYAFLYKQKTWAYLTGFDPKYLDYRVGHLTFMYDVRDCIERGLNEFDFMRGDEPYKSSYSVFPRKNVELRAIHPHSIVSRLYDWASKNDRLSFLSRRLGERISLQKRRKES